MKDLDNIDLKNNKAEDVVGVDEEIDVTTDTSATAEGEKDVLLREIEELRDKTLRIAADYENAKRRHEKQIEDIANYSVTNFAKDLMSVMDNLSRALEHIPLDMSETIKNFVVGVEMTKLELTKVFEKHSIQEIAPTAGDKFDYNIHHAIIQVPTTEHPKGTILQTMQTGYKIKDRLIRPASVSVSKEPDA